MRVLITGGTGFVGYWLNMTASPYTQILSLNRHGYKDLDTLTGFDYVIHAAHVSPTKALDCARRNNARLLLTSSGIVTFQNVDTEYRRQKVEWEKQCIESGQDVVIARLYSFFGDRLDPDKAQTIFTKQAKHNEDIHLKNNGNTVRTYMHGAEMARWIWRILQGGAIREIYEVGSDTPVTMLELAEQIIKENNSRSRIVVYDTPDTVPVYIPRDTQKTLRLYES